MGARVAVCQLVCPVCVSRLSPDQIHLWAIFVGYVGYVGFVGCWAIYAQVGDEHLAELAARAH